MGKGWCVPETSIKVLGKLGMDMQNNEIGLLRDTIHENELENG